MTLTGDRGTTSTLIGTPLCSEGNGKAWAAGVGAGELDPHYVEPPPSGLPPLRAYAVPDSADAEPAQDGLSTVQQIGDCIHEAVGAVFERHDG